jgi:hypothetical protein
VRDQRATWAAEGALQAAGRKRIIGPIIVRAEGRNPSRKGILRSSLEEERLRRSGRQLLLVVLPPSTQGQVTTGIGSALATMLDAVAAWAVECV